MARQVKPVSAATRALLDEMKQDAVPKGDKLEQARKMLRDLRDKQIEADQLEARLAETKQEIRTLTDKTMPDFYDEAGIPAMTIAAEGNLPAFEIEVIDRYHANIPDESRDAAFAHLRKTGHADLIKTSFTIEFGLRETKQADRFRRSLEKSDIAFSEKHGVPWNTLTSWFKAEHKKKPMTPKVMGMLGASVGRVVKIIKQKEKK